jgi:hypothetical protein
VSVNQVNRSGIAFPVVTIDVNRTQTPYTIVCILFVYDVVAHSTVQIVTQVANDIWGGPGVSPPLDQPTCGYTGELCDYTPYYCAGGAIAFVAILLVAAAIARKQQLVNEPTHAHTITLQPGQAIAENDMAH